MLHHVSVGVADVARAAQFYDPVLRALGYRRVLEFLPHAIGYGDKQPQFWVQLPHDRQPAKLGNGVHIAFNAASEAVVRAFHGAALGAGGLDDGAPGPRPDYGPEYFGAFVRDLDGNKIEAVLVRLPAAAAAKKKARKKSGKKKARVAKKRSKVRGKKARKRR